MPNPSHPEARQLDPNGQNERYSRQILFPGIGAKGQELLARAHVAIVGVGATGAASASLLARAGVGTLTLIDRDFVEPSNLQRQILFDEADARDALPKAEAAKRHIARFNSEIRVVAHITDLVPANIHELLSVEQGVGSREQGVDCGDVEAGDELEPMPPVSLILDATDNFETRYLINDYAVQTGTPWIYAAAIGAYAATMTILPRPFGDKELATPLPCSLLPSCLPLPAPPTGPVETCDTAGILSTAVNLAASIQVTEALKILTGQFELLRRTLYSHDLWTNERSEIAASKPNPGCPVCAKREFRYLSGAGRPHITLCGRNSVQIHEHHRPIDLPALHTRLSGHADVEDLKVNPLLLRFRRGPQTLTVFPDGRALIQGTTDIPLARTLYARFIGS